MCGREKESERVGYEKLRERKRVSYVARERERKKEVEGTKRVREREWRMMK